MFALSSKRPRGDEILGECSIREKKVCPDLDPKLLVANLDDSQKRRPLPLQATQNAVLNSFSESNSVASQFRPPALTPVESSDDDDDADNKHLGDLDAMQQPSHEHFASDSMMDLDAAKGHPLPPPSDDLSSWPGSARSNASLQPSPIPRSLVNHSLNITTPTPGDLSASVLPPPAAGSVSGQHMDLSSSLDTEGRHDAWWDRRRLPTPISEDEGSSGKCSKAISKESSGEMVRNTYYAAPPWDPFRAVDPHPPHPARTPSTKKKVGFSMGYRADCDKCRLKVPGHYSHIDRA